MKDFINNPENIRKIELWGATTIYVFAIVFLIASFVSHGYKWAPNKYYFDEANIKFFYFKNYFIPQIIRYTILYVAFLGLNFYVVPKLLKQKDLIVNSAIIILTIGILTFVFGATNTYLKNYLFLNYTSEPAAYKMFFTTSFFYAIWLIILFGFYTIIKQVGIYLLTNAEDIQAKYKFVIPGILPLTFIWMILMFLLLAGNVEKELIVGFAIASATAIIFFWHAFSSLIPLSLDKKHPFTWYLSRTLIILILISIPMAFIAMFAFDEPELLPITVFMNTAFNLFFTAPLIWIIYKSLMRGKAEIYMLKKELGQSNANFDFLRSQINPHFLFNALNTIYGTALQEKAQRTGEGIEKLGDMMRFMLQENVQEKIALSREIEYLNNYIGLQKLRTEGNSTVVIQTNIQEPVNMYQISPMLLIPFVENAFKHGISFRETSYINVTLEIKENVLYFDVYNSKHLKQDNDPEKYKSGIGLNNVKQRLELLYSNNHELIIRETGKEYFVHLTLQLK